MRCWKSQILRPGWDQFWNISCADDFSWIHLQVKWIFVIIRNIRRFLNHFYIIFLKIKQFLRIPYGLFTVCTSARFNLRAFSNISIQLVFIMLTSIREKLQYMEGAAGGRREANGITCACASSMYHWTASARALVVPFASHKRWYHLRARALAVNTQYQISARRSVIVRFVSAACF